MPNTLNIEIRTTRKELQPAAVRAFAHLEEFDWILFSSKNAVLFFQKELSERNIQLPKEMTRIAAIGPVTATALSSVGFTVDTISKEATVRSLLQSIGDVRGKSILFPRSDIAPQDPIRLLQTRGAFVTEVPLYITEAQPLSEEVFANLLQGSYEEISFKSPSGVHGLLAQLTPEQSSFIKTIPAVCIGPTTAQAARIAGFKTVSITAIPRVV